MKNKRFWKNKNGVYYYSIFKNSVFWLILSALINIAFWILYKFLNIDLIYLFMSFIPTIILTSYHLVLVNFWTRNYSSLREFLICERIKNNIMFNFLDSTIYNTGNDSSYIDVPVPVVYKNDDSFSVFIEKNQFIGQDDMIEIVNHAFRNRLSDYAIYDFEFNDNEIDCSFYIRNVNKDERLIVEDLYGFLDNPSDYGFKIQEGLIWNLKKCPHCIVTGKTGSGKSTFLRALILQAFFKKHQVYILDPKNEFADFKHFMGEVYSEKEDIINMMDRLSRILEDRNKEVSEHISRVNQFGLTSLDFDLKPHIIIFDELSAFVAGLDSKEKKSFESNLTKIVQKGRSAGLFLIVAMQNANSETIKIAVRNQFKFRVLLGNSTNEDIQFMFSSNNETVKRTVKAFTGYYMMDGFTNTPQKIFVPDLISHGFDKPSVFKSVYNL